MPNINFVPDDYVQSNESRRANLMCLVLFSVVMAALGGSFVTIKIRQRACGTEESLVNARMARMQESIKKFEELQTKRKEMMKTALTTAELIEPVPRSVLLASLTNTLPVGVSLVKLDVRQAEESKGSARGKSSQNKYEAAQSRKGNESAARLSAEEKLDTHMDIEGMAPSDIQVAEYIRRLGNSLLLDNVVLVESAEKKVEGTSFRHFKLKAMLAGEVHLTKEDVDEIRSRAEHSIYQF
ncbi:MAG: PilN domain-containing protein [Sedimentisphaerales bacterium]|nr:PilN domain-containing protein [Sedimentisphaerales bacterium]HNY80833.1 PilN domain-containing protein [Sedimentisphaerales bacterium]HOC65581.1 PilN domain-containing protein [Sedimentisphaerales bacterium]HOH66714.1 PilN domain-containing protein [Sedimentisphaerales bacterium]HPY48921.1 PilN domain-containing protein [Sedimentisphaerales bacterium]